jgi:protein involved in polysaccharide export with SLBB domain
VNFITVDFSKGLAVFAAVFLLTNAPACAVPVVHPGDTLGVDVLNYAAVIDDSQGRLKGLNTDNVVVAADGSISIPVAGTLEVAGKSTSEIGRIIESRLSTYLRHPAVNVRLVQQSQLLFLTGATTGTLPFLPGETLSSALGQLREQFQKDASAGVIPGEKLGNVFARSSIDLRKIVVQRDGLAGDSIDGEALLRSGRPGPALVPGDTLLFANKPVQVDIQGEVASPGPIYLYRTDTLEQAVLAAGGPLPSASTADASLIRNGKEVAIPLGSAALRQVPEDGDTIVVRAAPHVTVLGQVPTPGEFTLKNGSTLLTALYVAGGPTKWANVRDVQVVHGGVRSSHDLSNLQHGDLSTNVPLVDGDVVYVPEGHKIDASAFFQGLIGALGGAYNVTHL